MAAPDSQASQRTPPKNLWTNHLRVTTYASESAIAPGERVSLVLEIQPGPRMHVYAPGAEKYQVISVSIDTQPFVRVLPLQYPPSEIYFFEPLEERIPVYQKEFTLIQGVELDDQPEARAAFRKEMSLSLTGTLNYQACDDKICFQPVSVPLSWTLELQHPGSAGAVPNNDPALQAKLIAFF